MFLTLEAEFFLFQMMSLTVQYITRTLNFELPEKTNKRHICQLGDLTSDNAVRQCKEERNGEETPVNHIFENCVPFTLYTLYTISKTKYHLAVSNRKMTTYCCTYSDRKWTSKNLGQKYAVFEVFHSGIVHFPGPVYDHINIVHIIEDSYSPDELMIQCEENVDPIFS